MGYSLRQAYSIQLQRFNSIFSTFSIRPVQFSILCLIYDNPQLRQSELGRMLGAKRANVVTLLHELEERDLVRRVQAEDDRRSYILELTRAGSRLTAKLFEAHARLEEDTARALGRREHAELVRLLKKVRQLDREVGTDSDDRASPSPTRAQARDADEE